MEWLLIGGFVLGLVFPPYNIKRRYFFWILGGWILLLLVAVIYSYIIWTPPQEVNGYYSKLMIPDRQTNAFIGFLAFILGTVYVIWPYTIGFVLRFLFDWVNKKRKKK